MKAMITGLAAVVAVAVHGAASAQDSVSAFYAGKTIELLVSTGPGTAYDAYARVLARFMPRHLPGKPSIICRNMDGAGGITATNYLANIAPKDGSVFAIVNNPIPYQPLFGQSKALYDSGKLNWLGSMAAEVALLVSTRESGIDTLEKVIANGMTVAVTGAGSGSYFNAHVLNRFVAPKLKIVAGYKTSAQGLLAMEQNEVDGFPDLMWSTLTHVRPDWLQNGKINILGQLSLTPLPHLPNVPLVINFVHNEADRQALELAFAPLAAARPLVAPPNVPAERVEALRTAITETLADPEFQGEVAQQRLDTERSMSGKELTAFVDRVYRTPPEVVASVASLLK